MVDNMELFKHFQDNQSFKKWLPDMVFKLTYNLSGKPYVAPGTDKVITYDKFQESTEHLKVA